ncbi:Immunoglobulin V-set domain [Parelaphostrongylus tenuis]|uniref:Immunoglobulin V-set domain n=1 Tax=Parelaphostrongylus tenuis TaxID=148309 RepID=A0AAD5QZB3_PARTN|nr:Immunoglobulin V-set domain [Parelaphostrongylus tenuis]
MLYNIFYYLCLIVSSHAFSPPHLQTDRVTQHDPSIGDFVELQSGDDIRLTCSDITNEAVEFQFPNLTDNRGYVEEDFNERHTIENLSYGHTLYIKNLKESDTGTYICHSKDDHTLRSEIHIFVRSFSMRFSQKMPSSYQPFMKDWSFAETEFVVPCKSSRHLSKDYVELWVNGKLWKSASKYFDPRIGFKINSKNAEDKIINQLTFKCVHKGYPPDTATFLIVLEKLAKTISNLFLKSLILGAYVGGQYTLSCILKLKGRGRIENKYQYQLQVTCPRCSQPTVVHKKIIANWYFDKVLNETIHKNVDVSPKKGQIKVLGRTPQEVNVQEGNSINLSAELAAFPDDLPGFNAKWIRKFIKPPKTVNETENLVSDNDHQIVSERMSGGHVNEKITIKNAANRHERHFVNSAPKVCLLNCMILCCSAIIGERLTILRAFDEIDVSEGAGTGDKIDFEQIVGTI